MVKSVLLNTVGILYLVVSVWIEGSFSSLKLMPKAEDTPRLANISMVNTKRDGHVFHSHWSPIRIRVLREHCPQHGPLCLTQLRLSGFPSASMTAEHAAALHLGICFWSTSSTTVIITLATTHLYVSPTIDNVHTADLYVTVVPGYAEGCSILPNQVCIYLRF